MIAITRIGGDSPVVKLLMGVCLNRVQVSASECRVVVTLGFLTEGNRVYLFVKFYRLYCITPITGFPDIFTFDPVFPLPRHTRDIPF